MKYAQSCYLLKTLGILQVQFNLICVVFPTNNKNSPHRKTLYNRNSKVPQACCKSKREYFLIYSRQQLLLLFKNTPSSAVRSFPVTVDHAVFLRSTK